MAKKKPITKAELLKQIQDAPDDCEIMVTLAYEIHDVTAAQFVKVDEGHYMADLSGEFSNESFNLTDASDLATILAALRMFQKSYRGRDAKDIRADWPEHFHGIKPLGTEDIDTLCERLNQ